MKTPIHRVTGDSKRGRQLRARNARVVRGPGLTAEQIAWNASIEAARQAKKARQRNG